MNTTLNAYSSDAAQSRFEKLLGYLQLDPDNLALLDEASDLGLSIGAYEQTRLLLEKYLALDSLNPAARYRMAVLLFVEKKPEASIAFTQSLVDGGERHHAVLYQHAQNLIQLARYEEAESWLALVLPYAAEFVDFSRWYVRNLHYLGKVTEAIAYLQQLPTEQLSPELQGMLSLLYLDVNEQGQAGEVAEAVLKTNPRNLDALLAAGYVSLGLENAALAKTRFEDAIETNAQNGRAWLGMGLVSMLASDFVAARKHLERTIEVMPTHLGSWITLAWILIIQQEIDTAEALMERCLQLNHNFGETHGTLAVIAAIRGDWKRAQEESTIGLRLQPDSFSSLFARSLVLASRGRNHEAQAIVNGVLENFKTPGGGNLRDMIQRHAIRYRDQPKKPNN